MEEMTLRDKFACFVATGMAINEFALQGRSAKIIAANAYRVADAMLEARSLSDQERNNWAIEGESNVL